MTVAQMDQKKQQPEAAATSGVACSACKEFPNFCRPI